MQERKLPRVRACVNHASDRSRLERWLVEWRIEEGMGDPMLKTETRPGGLGARRRKGSARGAVAGEVRLLMPDTPETSIRPCYVLLLAPGGRHGTWCVVPFGRFSVPAFPGEIGTLHPSPFLRVLCCWNARDVKEERLSRSWPVSAWPADELALTTGFCRVEMDPGMAAPPAWSERTGPPVIHPCDPRLLYIERERAAADTLGPPVQERSRFGAWHGKESRLPLAAETPSSYGEVKKKPPEY